MSLNFGLGLGFRRVSGNGGGGGGLPSISDDFNRAGPELGAAWTERQRTTNSGIIGNELTCVRTSVPVGGWMTAYLVALEPDANLSISFDARFGVDNGAVDQRIALWLHSDVNTGTEEQAPGAGADVYELRLQPDMGSACQLTRYDNGSGANIGATFASGISTSAVPVVVGLTVNAGDVTITVTVNGVLKATRVDAHAARKVAAGYFGIALQSSNNASASAIIDNLVVSAA